MRAEIMEALMTIVICGALGAVVWYTIYYIKPTAPSLWWLVLAVVLIGIVGAVLIVVIDNLTRSKKEQI